MLSPKVLFAKMMVTSRYGLNTVHIIALFNITASCFPNIVQSHAALLELDWGETFSASNRVVSRIVLHP